MFLTGYLFPLLAAVLPLARTISMGQSRRPGVMFLHRLYRDLAYIAAVVRAIVGFEATLARLRLPVRPS